MTNKGFGKGMLELAVAFPAGREESEQVASERSRIYREHLNDLTDDQFLYAVAQAVKRDRWFPTVAALLEYAEGAPSARPSLPAPRSPEAIEETREQARANLRNGLELIRQEAVARGLALGGNPVKEMPASTGEEA